MVDVPCYPGDYLRTNNDGMYYSQNMYQFRPDHFNTYLPHHAIAQRQYSPIHHNIPPHNYVHESQYLPPCTPMGQVPFCNEQPDSPQDISPFHTPPQKMPYYTDSSDGYSRNLVNDMSTSYVPTSQSTSESTESEEMNKEEVKNVMSKQILAIIEQQGPTANGKRKRIKKGTLTESQKVYLRRERNRVAATKCREKRKHQSSVTKLKYDEYNEKNLEIRMEIERLEREKEYLLSVLESHSCIKTPRLTS